VKRTRRITIMHVRDSGGIFGGERVILTLAKNMNKEIFNFRLLCMRRDDGISEQLIANAKQLGIKVDIIDVKGRLDLAAIIKLRKILRKHNVSILHSHDFKSNFYGLLASANLSIKRVTTAHGSTRDSFLKRAYLYGDEKVTYRFFDRIIAVSDDLRHHLVRRGLREERIKVIQNGLDFDLLKNDDGRASSHGPLPALDGRKVFGVIGRLFPDKGHRFFLEAFSKIRNEYPDIAGLIVGEGPERSMLLQNIKGQNLQESVFLAGVRSDMKNVYGRLNFLVIPSLTEGLPYVLLEAMASRIPVVATSVGDIPLLIKDGVNGYLVPPCDVQALSARMAELLRNPRQGEIMAQKACQLVEEKYSSQRMVKQTEHLYVSLLQLPYLVSNIRRGL
jgi:glycosyltransferase involved in cell wall biosynthesis